MKIAEAFKKFLVAIGFVAFMSAGYLSLNVATSCNANAQICHCSICTYAAGGMITQLGAVVTPWVSGYAIPFAYASVTTQFELAMMGFTTAVAAKIFETQQNMVKWWDEFWNYNLLPAMKAMTVQLNVRDADQSRAMGAMGDAMDANRTNLALMEEEIQSHRELRPSENACVAATVSGGLTQAANIRRAYNAAAPAEQLPRSGNRVGSSAAGGSGPDIRARWAAYTANYCDPEANAGAAGCVAAGADVNRDLDVVGEIFEKDTIDVRDADTKRVVDDLLINIAEPFTMDPVPASAATSPQGQQRILAGEAYKAKRQVVYDALYHVVARRVPGGTATADFVNAMRAAGTGGSAGMDPSYISSSPSHNEVMEVMMSERYRTGDYGVNQVDTPVNNMRESVVQQAFLAMQMSDMLDLLDRYALVVAAQVGAEINQGKPGSSVSTQAPVQ